MVRKYHNTRVDEHAITRVDEHAIKSEIATLPSYMFYYLGCHKKVPRIIRVNFPASNNLILKIKKKKKSITGLPSNLHFS